MYVNRHCHCCYWHICQISSLSISIYVRIYILYLMSSHLPPPQAIFSSVLPGEYMSGHLSAQIEFPAWFGKNSRRNKFDRLTQDLQMHMRLRFGMVSSIIGVRLFSCRYRSGQPFYQNMECKKM